MLNRRSGPKVEAPILTAIFCLFSGLKMSVQCSEINDITVGYYLAKSMNSHSNFNRLFARIMLFYEDI